MDNNGSSRSLIDPDEIQRRVDRAYTDAGYSMKSEDDGVVPDEEKMKERVFELVTSKVVPSRHQKSEYSWTQGELYASTFPDGPGADGTDPDQLSANDREVRKALMRKVWNLTNPGVQGFVQKRLGAEGSRVVCRGRVMRGLDEVQGVYVTDDPDVIMHDSIDPQVEALVRKAASLRKHIDMVGGRHPELEGRIAGALSTGIDRTRAALPAPPTGGGKGSRTKPTGS
jgi:hypothetical protein